MHRRSANTSLFLCFFQAFFPLKRERLLVQHVDKVRSKTVTYDLDMHFFQASHIYNNAPRPTRKHRGKLESPQGEKICSQISSQHHASVDIHARFKSLVQAKISPCYRQNKKFDKPKVEKILTWLFKNASNFLNHSTQSLTIGIVFVTGKPHINEGLF